MADNPALDIRDVRKDFGRQRAVDGVNFDIKPGEIFGLLGPNGAGKSTLIGMISGLTTPTSGTISVFGRDNRAHYRLARRWVGVMPQEIVIDNFFSVDQSLRIHAGYYGVEDDPAWRERLVSELALGPYLKKKPLHLSGGTKRRLMLAKALIHKPRLLILDEPTAGVDVELRRNIWSFVRQVRDLGTTVLLTTHYLEEAQEMCDRIGILASGKIVALESTAKLLRSIDDRKLVVQVQSPLDSGSEAVTELKGQLSADRLTLTVPLSAADALGALLERIGRLPSPVLDVESKRADLEDVFLSLISKKEGRRV